MTVNPPPTASCVVINAVQGAAITPVTMTGSGGSGAPYTFSATGLPAGLTMSASGTISGTPTVSGTFSYTITIKDSAGNTGTVNCSVTVNPKPTATCIVINAIQGVAITPVTMAGSGGTGGPYTFSATGLPTGLTMSAAGTISGTPTVSGTFTYTVTVTDKDGHTGTGTCSVTVNPAPTPLSVSCSTVTSGLINVPFNSPALTVTGGTSPYTFSVATGTLPTGLTLNAANGSITGTPTSGGTFTLQVTDAKGAVALDTCPFTISALPSCGATFVPLTDGISESGANAGQIVWFNSHLTKLGGTIPTSDFQIFIQNGKITFGTLTLTVPNAVITFTSTVSCATTSFDTAANTWRTTLPLSAAASADEIFAGGLAYPLPTNFSQNVSSITWSATVYSTAPALQLSWQHGASNWLTSKNGTNFPMSGGQPDYNAMMIDPAHNAPLCNSSYNAGDHAGAPEFAGRSNLLTSGGSGGGGSNWTGSWCSTPPPVSIVCSNPNVVDAGDAATIGFWHNQNGQALILSLNGGSSAKALGNWLATTFPYLYGAYSTHNLTNQSNTVVAALFLTFFNQTGAKTSAQIMAGALATYVTNSTLGGTNGIQYGFHSTPGGTGAQTYNVGAYGTAIGLVNYQSYTVTQLLQQANLMLKNGTFNSNAFNAVFNGINTSGDIIN